MKGMTIGQLARATTVHVETIRFYQRRGLLAEPRRPQAGPRRYGEEAAARLRFIKRAQDIGFTLDEVAELLRLERRISDLSRVRRTLRELIGRCEAGSSRSCPIIDSLASA